MIMKSMKSNVFVHRAAKIISFLFIVTIGSNLALARSEQHTDIANNNIMNVPSEYLSIKAYSSVTKDLHRFITVEIFNAAKIAIKSVDFDVSFVSSEGEKVHSHINANGILQQQSILAKIIIPENVTFEAIKKVEVSNVEIYDIESAKIALPIHSELP